MTKKSFQILNYNKLKTFVMDHIAPRQVLSAFVVFIVVSILLIFISYLTGFYDKGDPLNNILTEAHGMLFDILIIGCFILWLNKIGERKHEINRYKEEIDDYRGWDEKEATFRIIGNIKRLNRLGVRNTMLNGCYLVKVDFHKADLRKVDFTKANLQGANLTEADLQGANFTEADLQGANFTEADLQGANLAFADLKRADLTKANLRGAVLAFAELNGTNFTKADLREGALYQGKLKETNLIWANLKGARKLIVEQLVEVKTLYKANLDGDLMKEIQEKHPHLLEISVISRHTLKVLGDKARMMQDKPPIRKKDQ